MITTVDVRNRVMALCNLVPLPAPLTFGVAYTDEPECAWEEADLPAYVVEESGRGNEYSYGSLSPRQYTTRTTIRILLWLSYICDESITKDIDNVDLANQCRAAVIHFFACHQRLELNGSPLVDRAQITRDTSPHTGATKGATTKYRILVFNMTVEYDNYAQ